MLLWKSRHVRLWNGPEIIGIMASISAEGWGLLIDQSRFGTGFRILNKARCLQRVCGLVTKRWCGLLFRSNSPLIRPHTCAAVVITVFHRKIACYPFRSRSVTSVPTIKILNQFRSLSCWQHREYFWLFPVRPQLLCNNLRPRKNGKTLWSGFHWMAWLERWLSFIWWQLHCKQCLVSC